MKHWVLKAWILKQSCPCMLVRGWGKTLSTQGSATMAITSLRVSWRSSVLGEKTLGTDG